jgi:hypothetical protein
MRDYLGRQLCHACWNGNHYLTKHTADGKKTSTKLSNCSTVLEEDGTTPCDCPCRQLLEEQEDKRRAFWDNYRQQIEEAEARRQRRLIDE